MLWLAYYNPEIDWKIGEVKMMRCPEKCGKQWRLKQGNLEWEKQKEEEKKKQKENGQKKEEKKKPKKKRMIKVKKVIEKQEIWDEEEEVARSEEEARKLVPERFHKWIHVFDKKASKRMPTRKLWDYTIDIKKGFVPKKGKAYLLSREEREEVCEFILEQLRKKYTRLSKSPQTALVFFVERKDRKKHMIQNYRYLNEQTVKNNYPLSLILDIIENIGTKKIFTKINLRWRYNNIQIKKRDK